MSVSDKHVSDIDIPATDCCPHDERWRAALDNLPGWQLRITRIGSHLNEAEYNTIQMTHPTWGLYICDRPGMYLERGGKRHVVGPDHITLFPPWVGYTYHFSKKHSSGHAYIHVDIPRLPAALIRAQFRDIYHIDEPHMVQQMWQWSRRFSTSETDELMLSLEAQNIASQVITAFLLQLSPEQQQVLINPDQRWQRLQPALHWINQRLDQHISVGELAALLDCSNEHCIRLFKKMIRQTPTQYILMRRVERAAELLISTRQDIDSIAVACGFPNRQYLSRVFKRHMGFSPAQYRGMA